MINKSTDGKTRILSLSYGKDSMACLGAIEELGWTLDRIVTAEVWATDTIQADLPPMVEFKDYADRIIKERYGIEVEHYYAIKNGEKHTYERLFYERRKSGKFAGGIKGWTMVKKCEAQQALKMSAINRAKRSAKESIQYIGIAIDEPNRFHNLADDKLSPLVEIGWTEQDAKQWCEKNELLSPIYSHIARGGCFFCPCQSTGQLRLLRKNYPELWQLMLKWDADMIDDMKHGKERGNAERTKKRFTPNGHTVHDYDRRFSLEDDGLIDINASGFKWRDTQEVQLKLF